MRKIYELENIDNKRNYDEQGINYTIYWAYKHSREAGNHLLNFDDVIWDYDINAIVDFCQRQNIKQFTISCTFSELFTRLSELANNKWYIECTMEVRSRYNDIKTGEPILIPAIKMIKGEN